MGRFDHLSKEELEKLSTEELEERLVDTMMQAWEEKVAPGNTAPDSSFTVPLILPVMT